MHLLPLNKNTGSEGHPHTTEGYAHGVVGCERQVGAEFLPSKDMEKRGHPKPRGAEERPAGAEPEMLRTGLQAAPHRRGSSRRAEVTLAGCSAHTPGDTEKSKQRTE